MKEHVLTTLADQNFIPQAKQLFSSAYWNGGWQGDFLLLAHEIPKEDLRWFREKGIIVFPCRALGEGIIGERQHPATVLSKFYLFTPFFKQWKTVVYLDADIIVKASLERLTETTGFLAPNATGLNFKKEFSRKNRKLFKELRESYSLRGRAFNTGVFAFNTDFIQDNSFDEITALYRKFGPLNLCGEEGTFNLYFYRQWKMLSVVYNAYPKYMNDTYGLGYERLRAIIVHFVESIKPWDLGSPFHAEWTRNLKRADAMNFSQRPAPVKVWTEEEEKKYLHALAVPGFFISLAFHTRPLSSGIMHAWWRIRGYASLIGWRTMGFTSFVGWHIKIFAANARWRIKAWSTSLIRSFNHFTSKIDRLVGRIGLFIKKVNPHLYEKIRIKHGQ